MAGVPPANPQPPYGAVHGTAAPPAPTTYSELFADAANDPYQGNYAGIMQVFGTTLQPVPPAEAALLANRVFGKAEVELQAYLIVSHIQNKNHIQVIHRPSTLRAPLSSNAPDQRFAFIGDGRGRQPPQLVAWPDHAFEQTISLNVVGLNAIDTALAADPSLQLLGPFPDDAAGVEAITTRKLMYLPAKYVQLALGKVQTPREAWDCLGGAIRGEPQQIQQDLKPLLDWLKAALTRFDATDVPAAHLGPPAPPAIVTTEHQDHSDGIISNDLPLPAAGQAPAGLAPLVGAVNQLTAEVVQTRNDEAARRANAAVKTVQQYYGQAVDILLRVTHSPSEAQLPPVYQLVANSTKRTLRVTLQEHFRSLARDLGQDSYAPIILPELAAKIASATFDHNNINDLQDGIQPFITPAWSAEDKAELRATNEAYDTIQDGASATLQDLYALRALTKISPPLTLLQTLHTFKSFGILLTGLLGDTHALTLGFNAFVAQFNDSLSVLEVHALRETYYCMRLVRYMQIRISNWFNSQVTNPARIVTPEFHLLITKIKDQDTSWKPLIPRRYLPQGASPSPAPSPGPAPAPAPGPGVSPPAAPAPAPAPSGAPAGDGSNRLRINNTNYNPAYQAYRDRNMPLAQVRAHARQANDPVPRNDDNVEMCLCYHVLGYCWNNCSRLSDHWTQSAAEVTRLQAWCTAHYV